MAATENMEILLKADKKPEATAVLQFLDELSEDEKLEFMGFMRGARFIKELDRQQLERARAAAGTAAAAV